MGRLLVMLFDYGVEQGMGGFEHDYLDYNYLSRSRTSAPRSALRASGWPPSTRPRSRARFPCRFRMALPSALMAAGLRQRHQRRRASTDYGISDEVLPLQPRDDNLNIGGVAIFTPPSSVQGRARTMGRTPTRGVTRLSLARRCGGKGARSNPGSNIELNALVATLSRARSRGIADKARETKSRSCAGCAWRDGRILQPDKPATASRRSRSPVGARARADAGPGLGHVARGGGVALVMASTSAARGAARSDAVYPAMPEDGLAEFVAHPAEGHRPTA